MSTFIKRPKKFQAEDFIDETSIDALAVCIGNVHGKYPASGPNLRLDLLKVKYNYLLNPVLLLNVRGCWSMVSMLIEY